MLPRHAGPSKNVKGERSVREKRAAIYVRVSTSEQDTALQETELRQYVESRGWNCVVYQDKAQSGAKNDRPARAAIVALSGFDATPTLTRRRSSSTEARILLAICSGEPKRLRSPSISTTIRSAALSFDRQLSYCAADSLRTNE
jgi:hypothetical protein